MLRILISWYFKITSELLAKSAFSFCLYACYFLIIQSPSVNRRNNRWLKIRKIDFENDIIPESGIAQGTAVGTRRFEEAFPE